MCFEYDRLGVTLMLRGITRHFSPACQSTMSRLNMYHGTVLHVKTVKTHFPGNLLEMTCEKGVEAKTKCVLQIVNDVRG